MKNILLPFAFIILTVLTLNAQPPQKFKYQAIIRNSTGDIIANQPVNLKISILNNSPTGTLLFSEIHLTNTNPFGLVNIEIGGGSADYGAFSGINWSSGDKYVQIELDETGGTSYEVMGTTQLLSVPYALYAGTAGSSGGSGGSTIDCYTSSNQYFVLAGNGGGGWDCEDFMKLSSTGVGINTNPSSSFDLKVYDNVGIGSYPSSSYELSVDGEVQIDDHLAVGSSTSNSYEVDVDGEVRIQDGLGVGTYPPYSGLYVGGSSNFYVRTSLSSGSGVPLVISSGEVKKESSSKRYKEDINSLDVDIDQVLQLQPVSFRYKASAGGDGSKDVGLIAEEVEEVVPDLVIYEPVILLDENGEPVLNDKNEPVFTGEVRVEGVKYDRLSIYLLEVIKEQQKQIEELQKSVDELK